MKKGAFIEFVQSNLKGGMSAQDKEKKYSYAVVEMAIGMIIQDLAAMDVRTGADNLMNYLISKSEFSVVENDGRFFFRLPLAPMSGPQSVSHVSAAPGERSYGIHTSIASMSMMKELKAGAMGTGIYPSNDRYYFTKDPFVNEVFVTMVPAFSEYDDEDEFVAGDQHYNLYLRVEEMFDKVSRRILDNRNDNSIEDERRVRG